MPTWLNIIGVLLIGVFLTEGSFAQETNVRRTDQVYKIHLQGAYPRHLRKVDQKVVAGESGEKYLIRLEDELLGLGYCAYQRKDSLLGDTTTVKITVGPVYEWGEVRVGEQVEWALSKSGADKRVFQKGNVNPKKTHLVLEKTIRYMENHGYPFARIYMDSVRLSGNQVHGVLTLDEGRLVRFDSVIVHGDLSVREAYLTNLLGVKEGSVYAEKNVRLIPERLQAVRFVQVVKPPEVYFTEDATKLHLYLNQRRASSFDGLIGFLPNPIDGSVLITGDVKLHLENALKQGELIELNWRKLQNKTQQLKVLLVSPFVFNSGVSLDAGLSIYRRDTLFVDVNRQLGVRYNFLGSDHVRFFFDRTSTDLISTSAYQSGVIPPFLDRTINSYGVGLFADHTDYPLNPSKGFAVDASVSVGQKHILKNDRIPEMVYDHVDLESIQWNGALKGGYFISIVKRLVWHQAVIASALLNEQLSNNEAFRIGGLKTLRGFDEESIYATSFAISRQEIRYQMDRDGFLFAFFDGAWYENHAKNHVGLRRDLPYGFGAGIAFGTKAGSFSLSYALGSQFNQPVQLRASKIHFGFISTF
jgi:outer membrane protein assembly factor BamA